MRNALRMPTILLAACIWTSPEATAAEETVDLSQICKTTRCRPAGTIKLRTKDGVKEIEQPGLPYVYNGNVTVLPGDEFDIEIDFADDGKPARVSLPGDTPRPDHTIHINFSQQDDAQGMMLSLSNGTAATVKYDAFIVLPDGRKGKTSSCPVRAGMSGFEMWPDAILQLLISNFRKQNDSDSMVCE